MTLRDPKNPARWADGSPRSQGHAFDTSYVVASRVDVKKEELHAKARKRSTRQVDAAYASGKNLSVGALRDQGAARRPKAAA